MAAPSPVRTRSRRRTRRYVLADPRHVAVSYAINPWMDPTAPFDPERARAQWTTLHATLSNLGHQVEVMPSEPDLPDLVFAANGALVLGRRALLSSYAHPQRQPETDVHRRWLQQQGLTVVQARSTVEGEGDLLVVGSRVLAGHGFRTSLAAHEQLRGLTPREVVSLELVDPRFYHLDTALGVVDERTIVWHPPAFTEESAAVVRRLGLDTITVDDHDAALLGCNLVSDGTHVIVPAGVRRLGRDLAARGLTVLPVDTSELRRAGGGPKCCVAEHHA